MRRVCFYHAGCPDGFGAAWAVWRAWGDSGEFHPRGHDDALRPATLRGASVVFVDIAPPNEALRDLGTSAAELVVLDHHVTSRDRFEADRELGDWILRLGHRVHFDLEHSGAVLAWRHFHPSEDVPELLHYVEDQDLWHWELPRSREVNAAIGSHPLAFDAWEKLSKTPMQELAEQGTPLVRAQRIEIARALQNAHPVWLGTDRVEAVNAISQRSLIGHELAERAKFGIPCGLVYRLSNRQVDVSLYSIGDFDVASIAASRGGGGHSNAAGFSVSLREWFERYA